MNNNENYRKAMDQIKASEELKQKTLEKIKQNSKRKNNIAYLKLLSACAVFVMIICGGMLYLKTENELKNSGNGTDTPNHIAKAEIVVSNKNSDLPRFKNYEELEKILEENYNSYRNIMKNANLEDAIFDTAETISTESATAGAQNKLEQNENDFSETNKQVENVDEADIVKTDGKYIYYVTNNVVYILDAENLNEISKIEDKNEKEGLNIYEIYLKDDKLVVLGNGYNYTEEKYNENGDFYNRVYTNYMAQAVIYDITDIANPTKLRTVSLDGSYRNSRMIGDNLYFLSTKSPSYYKGIEMYDVLPIVKDSASSEKVIQAEDIAYFGGEDSYDYTIVAGFNINEQAEVYTETFFGGSGLVYVSEQNLYLAQPVYKGGFWTKTDNIIYKFNLDNGKIALQCKGEVNGYLNNQFSMDEYEGNLRVATTSYTDDKAGETTNQLFILDENLNELSRIDNLAEGEKIYSVRFMGKVGYIVTFEQIDPLFVIDLSDPRNPVVKGELKIPGYSSYLHPYDETHIIGIGNNVRSNGYGGVTNSNVKMSMFDVSDLENPVEMFNIDIGGRYADTPLDYNHKALFYNKSKNLIGFPIDLREYSSNKDRNGFVIYEIDLEEGFKEYAAITQTIDYRTNIDRGIYVGNNLYTLSDVRIVKYDLNTMEKLAEHDLPFDYTENLDEVKVEAVLLKKDE